MEAAVWWIWSGSEEAPPLEAGLEGQEPEVRVCSLLQCPEALVEQVEPVEGLPRVGPVEEPGLLVVQAGPGWSGELWRKTYGWWMGKLPGDHPVPYVEEESGSWGCRS